MWLLAQFIPLTNLGYALQLPNKFEAQPIVNGEFSVDSFFFLSGFLVAYAMLPMMEEKKAFPWLKYYLHRYVRIIPSVAVFLLLHTYLHRYMGNGPAWSFMSARRDRCIKYGWSTLLFINNFYPAAGSVGCGGGREGERTRARTSAQTLGPCPLPRFDTLPF